jgi:hypothetical protein
VAQKSANTPCVPPPNQSLRDRSHDATTADERRHRQRLQCRDDGARALRAVFSSHDNWLSLGEAERDEWRAYFNRMLEWLHRLGYTPKRNPWSVLLKD